MFGCGFESRQPYRWSGPLRDRQPAGRLEVWVVVVLSSDFLPRSTTSNTLLILFSSVSRNTRNFNDAPCGRSQVVLAYHQHYDHSSTSDTIIPPSTLIPTIIDRLPLSSTWHTSLELEAFPTHRLPRKMHPHPPRGLVSISALPSTGLLTLILALNSTNLAST